MRISSNKNIAKVLAFMIFAGSMYGAPCKVEAAPNNKKNVISEYMENTRKQKEIKEKLLDIAKKTREIQKSLVSTGEEMIKAEEKLKEAEKDRDERCAMMENRIIATYERSKDSFFENLIKSKSMAECLRRAEYVSTIHAYDKKEFEKLKESCDKVENLKNDLEKKQASLKEGQEKLKSEEKDLQKLLEEKKEAASRLNKDLRKALLEEASKEGVLPKGDSEAQKAIIDAAKSQLGVPYVWGGTSPDIGLDCSGLVKYCYKKAGITLPRVACDQGVTGELVSDPKPGDMVCYGTHVGVYIGDGRMIHSPEPGDVVKIQNIYGSPWYMRAW